ncbi:hypothetical protein GQ53DRAFT_545919 [Thozetella sp. PMI_491]|nr:hypothetical protein GQ53DRAFT_545919 [Thozetella sp. PMI_491]
MSLFPLHRRAAPTRRAPLGPAKIDSDAESRHSVPKTHPSLQLLDLPPEIHILISQQLIYPDALSLKHTSRYFYHLVNTGVKLKIEWLIARRRLHLECPNNQRCDLGSDLRFCRGSVKLLMQRRREHVECESRPGLGCLVYGTPVCEQRRKLRNRIQRWLRVRLSVEMWWVMVAAIPLLCYWWWISQQAA